MRIIHLGKLAALTGFACLGPVTTSFAATVSCPGTLGGDLTRQVQVTGALAGGECYYQAGNFKGDDVSPHLGGVDLIDKDIAPNEGDEGGLLGRSSGRRETLGQLAPATHAVDGIPCREWCSGGGSRRRWSAHESCCADTSRTTSPRSCAAGPQLVAQARLISPGTSRAGFPYSEPGR